MVVVLLRPSVVVGGIRIRIRILSFACANKNNSYSSRNSRTITTAVLKVAAVMEDSDANANNDHHQHYNHTDPFNRFRWTSRESFQYMYGTTTKPTRPWHRVRDFYSHLILTANDDDTPPGAALSILLFPHQHHPHRHQQDQQELLQDVSDILNVVDEEQAILESKKPTGRWERVTFKIVLSYHGGSFDGWQKQPALNTVQGVVEKSLGRFVDDKKAQQLKDKSLPLEGCAVVAGRTDKGVTALQQVCSFYTWRKDVTCEDIRNAINDAAPGMVRAVSVSKVSRVFHPNFAAKWRRYFYIFPFDDGDQDKSEEGVVTDIDGDDDQMKGEAEYNEDGGFSVVSNGNGNLNGDLKPRSFSVNKVNELLRQLEGKSLSYKMFARDTKASRSVGPPTECFMFHARAAETCLPCINQTDSEVRVMCVELVANRFLRKMVRVLVATAIREAAAGANDDALLELMGASCRRATAPPAPPDGLCLVDVGYVDFRLQNCFIQ